MSSKSSTTASSSETSADDMEPVPANTQVVINTELIQGLVASGLLDRTAFSTAFAANVSNNVTAGSNNVGASGESTGVSIDSRPTGNSADNAVDLTHSDSDSESVSDVSVITINSSSDDESVQSVQSIGTIGSSSDESSATSSSNESSSSPSSIESVKSVKSVESVQSVASVKSTNTVLSVEFVKVVKVVREHSSSLFAPTATASALSPSPVRDLRKEFEPPMAIT